MRARLKAPRCVKQKGKWVLPLAQFGRTLRDVCAPHKKRKMKNPPLIWEPLLKTPCVGTKPLWKNAKKMPACLAWVLEPHKIWGGFETLQTLIGLAWKTPPLGETPAKNGPNEIGLAHKEWDCPAVGACLGWNWESLPNVGNGLRVDCLACLEKPKGGKGTQTLWIDTPLTKGLLDLGKLMKALCEIALWEKLGLWAQKNVWEQNPPNCVGAHNWPPLKKSVETNWARPLETNNWRVFWASKFGSEKNFWGQTPGLWKLALALKCPCVLGPLCGEKVELWNGKCPNGPLPCVERNPWIFARCPGEGLKTKGRLWVCVKQKVNVVAPRVR